jgi:excinuclease ABC subunit C
MAEPFQFARRLAFDPAQAEPILRELPAGAGVFALRGERATDQPYLTRAADVRRRLRRLLSPPEMVDAEGRPVLSRRLNLRERVRWIEWTETGSEFESVLELFRALHANFGEAEARKRMRLFPPYFLRVSMAQEHPRVYVTNRLSRRGLVESFGPFASRAAAERMAEAVGEIFKVRRCHEDLVVHPEHPGCAYGEMKRCLAPCKVACTAEEYAAEAQGVFAYLRSRGESLLNEIAARREAASEAMDFEAAAALHRQWEKARAVANSADPLVRAAGEVRALVVQKAAHRQHPAAATEPSAGSGDSTAAEVDAGLDAAVFLLENGRLLGPERLSTLGVRAVREQTAVGSSLFAQPLMLSAVPESAAGAEGAAGVASALSPEDRARSLLARLEQSARSLGEPEPGERNDALALFKRWYYRPEKSRAGEVLLPNADGSWPVRRLLNAAARVVLGPPAEVPAVDRAAADSGAVQQAAQTRVLHPGREGVERVVPVLPKRARSGRRGKAVLPGEVVL